MSSPKSQRTVNCTVSVARGDIRVRMISSMTLDLELPPSEVGKVIGKLGHTIRAIRHLLNASAERHNERVVFEIVEAGNPRS